MRKESWIVGAVCLIIGGLIGYIIAVQTAWNQFREPPHDHTHESSPAGAAASGSGLPPGHPVVTTAGEFDTLKKAVASAPKNLALVTELANKLYDAARYEEAIPYYKQALDLDAKSVGLSTDLGTVLFYAGRPDEALAQYDYSLQIDPRHVQTLHNRVIVQLQGKKDVQAASEALDRLAAVDPGNPSLPNLRNLVQSSGSKANPRQRIF
ncbi:MAG: tetratricopeptide repeat protein [Acidobacteriota bacterium]